jgi:hypothetical protein
MDNPSQLIKRVPRSEGCRMAHDFNNDLTDILRRCDLLIGLFMRQRRGGETVAVDSTSGASHDQPNC